MNTKLKSKKKGMITISDIPRVALFVGIAVFVVALMTQLSGNLRESQCDGTVGRYNFTYDVCCITTGGDGNTNLCNTTSSTAGPEFNITTEGIEGLATFGDWWTIMVLSIVLIIIIGLLYSLLGGANKGSSY